jgi:serine/threonine protein kinase
MGIVHRDLKPDNVFLIAIEDAQIFVKLLDFGISKSTNAACKVTREFDVLGTPDYMAPEQAISTAKADHRADQFALASMTYEMLTGKMPFVADTVPALLQKVVHENPPPPSYYAHGLPKDVDSVVLRAMAKLPDARYPTIQDYAFALTHAAESVLAGNLGAAHSQTPQNPPVMASLPGGRRAGVLNRTPTSDLLSIAQRYEHSLPIPENPRSVATDDTTRVLASASNPTFEENSTEPGTGSRQAHFGQPEAGTGQRLPHRPMLRSSSPNERESAPAPRVSIKPHEPSPPTMRSNSPASMFPPRAPLTPTSIAPILRVHTPGSVPPVRPHTPGSVPPPRNHAPGAGSGAPTGLRPITELETAIADIRRAVSFGEQQRAATQAFRAVHMARDCDEKSARLCLSEASNLLEPLLIPQVGGIHRKVALINTRVSSQGDWTPAHFFLLSRIEQPATVEELLDISPLSRPETLCFIADLSAQGIVRVE